MYLNELTIIIFSNNYVYYNSVYYAQNPVSMVMRKKQQTDDNLYSLIFVNSKVIISACIRGKWFLYVETNLWCVMV